jgi:hypothetical protein
MIKYVNEELLNQKINEIVKIKGVKVTLQYINGPLIGSRSWGDVLFGPKRKRPEGSASIAFSLTGTEGEEIFTFHTPVILREKDSATLMFEQVIDKIKVRNV